MAWNESLDDAVARVQTEIGGITGVAAAPENPQDASSGQWPISIAFPRLGEFQGGGSAQEVGLHTIIVQIHHQRPDLARSVATVLPYLESVAEVLLDDPTLNGTVTTISGNISYSFGEMSYAGIKTIGWQFEVPVKIRYTDSS